MTVLVEAVRSHRADLQLVLVGVYEPPERTDLKRATDTLGAG